MRGKCGVRNASGSWTRGTGTNIPKLILELTLREIDERLECTLRPDDLSILDSLLETSNRRLLICLGISASTVREPLERLENESWVERQLAPVNVKERHGYRNEQTLTYTFPVLSPPKQKRAVKATPQWSTQIASHPRLIFR